MKIRTRLTLAILSTMIFFTAIQAHAIKPEYQPRPSITVFSHTSCPWSRKMVNYLEAKGYKFEEVTIDSSRENYNRFLRSVGKGKVPVVAVESPAGGTQFRGYNPEIVTDMLTDYGYPPPPDYTYSR